MHNEIDDAIAHATGAHDRDLKSLAGVDQADAIAARRIGRGRALISRFLSSVSPDLSAGEILKAIEDGRP
jgi:hypothetical protein